MDVILLERIASLGQMGDVVRVRDGYARNYLLPQGKALRANDSSSKKFEEQRVHLEARNLERKQEAESVAAKVNGQSFIVVRQAGETGHLYGSVTTRDVAEIAEASGFSIGRNQVALAQPIKTIGLHEVRVVLHPEVDAGIVVNVARSEDEAERQARGEDVTVIGGEEEAPETEAIAEEEAEESGPAAGSAEEEAPAETGKMPETQAS